MIIKHYFYQGLDFFQKPVFAFFFSNVNSECRESNFVYVWEGVYFALIFMIF